MTSKYPLRLSWLRLCAILGVAVVLPLGGCQSEQGRPDYLQSDSDQGDTVILGRDRCATPQEGCDCETDGEAVNCGRTTETFDDYVTCSEGKRTCTDGKWGTCSSDRLVQRPLPATGKDGGPGISTAALGGAVVCPPGFDQCDPGCHQAVDSAGGFPVGTGLINSTTALKLAGMPRMGCTSLSVTASSPTVSVTKLSPLTTLPISVNLSAVLTPPCV